MKQGRYRLTAQIDHDTPPKELAHRCCICGAEGWADGWRWWVVWVWCSAECIERWTAGERPG